MAQQAIGGDLDDNMANVGLTDDGGFVVGGTSRSNISGDKTQNIRGFLIIGFIKWSLHS